MPLILAPCALLLLGAMGWLTWQALRSERREAEARAEAAFRSTVRLALWRLDSLLIPIIRREDSRPYFHYRPFYAEARAYNEMYEPLERDSVLVPSPLLTEREEFVLLHFEVGTGGEVSSPQAPLGAMRDEAAAHYVEPGRMVESERRLAELRSLIDASLLELTPDPLAEEDDDADPLPAEAPGDVARAGGLEARDADYATRRRLARAQVPVPGREEDRGKRKAGELNRAADRLASPPVRTEPMRARWLTGRAGTLRELVLTREVRIGTERVLQGVWLDWPALRARLRELIADLLPRAALAPVLSSVPPGDPAARLLASAPIALLPGEPARAALPALTPLRATLGVTWVAVLAAMGAIALVVRASVGLAERRARFVAAVTHELRTPLTTFRLYTQMLADGLVEEEGARREYLRTLRQESDRLSQIVENILEYARLGEGHGRTGEARSVRELADAVLPVLARRAGGAGMRLDVERGASLETLRTTLDARAVERVLFNLVDNACKYAAGARDRRVHVRIASEGGMLVCVVRDHGAGIPQAERRRVFEAFRRGRVHRDGLIPGVGLGLALAQGIASELGGRLSLEESGEEGTAFRFEAPLG